MKQLLRSKPTLRPNSPTVAWEFTAIGTKWWIGVFEPITPTALRTLKATISTRIDTFDRTYSRFRSDSLVTRISKQAGNYEFPADATALLDFYKQLYLATEGLLTPLIGKVLADAGYDANYSLRVGTLARPPAFDEVITVSANKITTKQPVILDFGAAGKGYLVDIISDLMLAAGVQHYAIDASGDILAHTPQSLRVGLEHPDDASQIIGVAELDHQALCGSAGNRRSWGAYHHIMNPHTLQPVRAVKAVWVMADTALLADGLATALFFVSPTALAGFNFEYVVVDKDNRIMHSAGFAGELFSQETQA